MLTFDLLYTKMIDKFGVPLSWTSYRAFFLPYIRTTISNFSHRSDSRRPRSFSCFVYTMTSSDPSCVLHQRDTHHWDHHACLIMITTPYFTTKYILMRGKQHVSALLYNKVKSVRRFSWAIKLWIVGDVMDHLIRRFLCLSVSCIRETFVYSRLYSLF